jgi:enoyl-CoA hydratase/carnithine racemase
MGFENILVDVDGPVATITLDRPDSLNALNDELVDEYESALADLERGDAVRVIRLKGAGRAFCSGYDLAPPPGAAAANYPGALSPWGTAGGSLAEMGQGLPMAEREMLRKQVERWLRIWNYRKPVVAQVHTYCLSGGLDLLSTTDLVFAAEGTRFGHPAARAVGIPVMLGMLPLKIGAQKTKRILFTGDLIDAELAEKWGLVDWVCAAEELDDRVLDYCHRVANVPSDALTVHKHVVNRWSELMGARTGAYESADFDVLYHTTPSYAEFRRRVGSDGLRSALAWRDDPFKPTESTRP